MWQKLISIRRRAQHIYSRALVLTPPWRHHRASIRRDPSVYPRCPHPSHGSTPVRSWLYFINFLLFYRCPATPAATYVVILTRDAPQQIVSIIICHLCSQYYLELLSLVLLLENSEKHEIKRNFYLTTTTLSSAILNNLKYLNSKNMGMGKLDP